MNSAKLFNNNFFYRSPPVAAFGYSNQLKIFREIPASKFQGQHAGQFRYGGLCSTTKTKIHRESFLRNFRTTTFENNFGGAASEKKTESRRRMCSNSCGFTEPFNFDYAIRFYKPKKELSSAIFTIKILVAETFSLGRQLKYCLDIFHV